MRIVHTTVFGVRMHAELQREGSTWQLRLLSYSHKYHDPCPVTMSLDSFLQDMRHDFSTRANVHVLTHVCNDIPKYLHWQRNVFCIRARSVLKKISGLYPHVNDVGLEHEPQSLRRFVIQLSNGAILSAPVSEYSDKV